VEQLWDDITRAYDRHIQVPGKETHFLILIAFVCSFGFIRGSAHMIRAQVSWWPGNVETKGGTHVHHLVWGILLLLSMGYMGLTLDEFALWLNLQDVYWSDKGRQSIDAVVVTTALLVIAVLGLEFWVAVWDAVLVLAGMNDGHAWIAVPVQLLGIALAVVCFRRGRKLTGIVGLFIPLVALVGAVIPRREPARSTA
jgi:hypothetical protein